MSPGTDRARGGLAQLGERRVRNAEVEGSNPLPSTTFRCAGRRRHRAPRPAPATTTGGEQRGAFGRKGSFFARVYVLVARIPRGWVVTYGQVARMLGAPRAARIVGWAMHGNPHGSRVPCHRVVQRGGSCSPNFGAGDPGAQRRLLEREGVRFLLDGRVDLRAHQWSTALQGPPAQMAVPRRHRRPD